jgi:uncharacterized protein
MNTTVQTPMGTTHHKEAKPHVHFDEKHVLHELRHHLPSQTPIKDFIHHNTLHAYQQMKFYDGIFKAGKIFGFQVTLELEDFRRMHHTGRIKDHVVDRVIVNKKGVDDLLKWKGNLVTKKYDTHNEPRIGKLRAHWKNDYHIDLDNLVQPLLFRILSGYLDQGISIWKFPVHKEGFLTSVRELEKNSLTSFFKTSRARKMLLDGRHEMVDLLKMVVGNEAFYEQYLFDQQFSHQGWSGMVAAVEDAPHTLMDSRKISLHDLIVFELLLEIDSLDHRLGKNWQPLTASIHAKPVNLFAEVHSTELQEVFVLWQDAFEWSYYDDVLAGIAQNNKADVKQTPAGEKIPNFQAIFCIDERECSLRRHIEFVDPHCETLSAPGFFGVEFYFQAENGQFYEKLCPAPVTPKYLIKETGIKEERKHELLYTNKAQTLLAGTLSTFTLGFYAAIRMMQNLFRPQMSPAISNAFTHMHKHSSLIIENKHVDDIENGLQVGFAIHEMAARVEGLLRGIGLVDHFAPIVYAIAHGSSSANNPHHSAHDCGACSGRPGSVNARVFAHMANHPAVRALLKEKGITIPETTWFVGGMHDTAADQIAFYDENLLTTVFAEKHKQVQSDFEKALDLNAKERSRRFASINTKNDLKKVRKDILRRSVSMFEPRPELGHGTNTLCIIGRRDLTKKLFLDRRAFLNSYDYRTDPDGKLLTGVMRPIGLVCGGINLEYYFSRVDNYKLGAGTKLPHNVVGLIGVANSSDGDLRPGLPLQMIEVHDPVRLLIIVEHFPEMVLKAIQSAPEIYEWYINEWVHIVAMHPETKEFFYFKEGQFTPYRPLTASVPVVRDINALIETAKEMETNHIVDATQENLPIYSIN